MIVEFPKEIRILVMLKKKMQEHQVTDLDKC